MNFVIEFESNQCSRSISLARPEPMAYMPHKHTCRNELYKSGFKSYDRL